MKKRVFAILTIVIAILLILVAMGVIYFKVRDSKISLIQPYIKIEYGNVYTPKIEELINLAECDFINVEEVKIENNIENEKEKEYPAVGIYEIDVHYKNIILKQVVEVKDSIVPEIQLQDKLELEFGTDLSSYDFSKLINITDLSETRYDIDLNNVNSNSSGEYIAKVNAEDIYSNKTEKEFTIIIKEKEKQEDEKLSEKQTQTDNSSKSTNSSKTESKVNSNNSSNSNSASSSKNEWTTDIHYGGQINDKDGDTGSYWQYGEEMELTGIDMSDWSIGN